MKIETTEYVGLSRKEVERILHAALELPSTDTITAIAFDSAHMAEPQAVMHITVKRPAVVRSIPE